MRTTRLIALTIFAIALGGAGEAHAGQKIRCKVLTIEASNEGGGIDEQLVRHRPVLTASPLSAYDTFRLERTEELSLQLLESGALILPAPYRGRLRFDRQEESALGLTLTIERDGGKPITIRGKVSKGAPLFAAGLPGTDGKWIVGVLCNGSASEIR